MQTDDPLHPIHYAFGNHQGLNADWSVCAWHITGNFHLIDNEDETVSVLSRNMENPKWEEADICLTFPYSRITDAVDFCRLLKGFMESSIKMFRPEISN
jgi:hypothetical protein